MLEHARMLMKELLNNNYQAYLIGGCVRDQLLGLEINDYDIVTNATLEEVLDVFINSSLDVEAKIVGRAFGVVMISFNQNIYEIATFRVESDYQDYRHPQTVEFVSTLKEDTRRRDFTINALAMDFDGNIIDYHDGLVDLENKLLVAIGDADQRLSEDPLRMMRAIRFAVEKNFTIENNLYVSIKNNAQLLQHISKERIWQEFKKIILCNNPSNGIRLLVETNLMTYIFKPVMKMKDFDQKNKYHNETLLEHSLTVIDNIADQNQDKLFKLRMAALSHDLGKLKTKKIDSTGTAHYYNHASHSHHLFVEMIEGYPIAVEQKNTIVKLVANHDEVILPKARHVYKFLVQKEFTNEDIDLLVQLMIADHLAHAIIDQNKINNLIDFKYMFDDYYTHKSYKISDLSINGQTLIEEFNIQGPIVGELLNYLREIVFYDQKVNTKEALLNIAKKYMNQK